MPTLKYSITGAHDSLNRSLSLEATITSDSAIIEKWLNEICGGGESIIMGFDWKRDDLGKRMATLQLCTKGKCLLVQLLHCSDLNPLKNFFQRADIILVGVDATGELAKLLDTEYVPSFCVVDLPTLGKSVPLLSSSREDIVEDMARRYLKYDRIPKPQNFGCEARVLSYVHVQYACSHAYLSYSLGLYLLTGVVSD